MAEKWLEEMEKGINTFFKSASDEEILLSLKDADYYRYTGTNPEDIILEKPVCIFHAHIVAQGFLVRDNEEFVASVENFESIKSIAAADNNVRYSLAA